MTTYDPVEIALLLDDHTPEEIRELYPRGLSDEDLEAGLELWRVLDWWGMSWLKQHQHPAHTNLKGN